MILTLLLCAMVFGVQGDVTFNTDNILYTQRAKALLEGSSVVNHNLLRNVSEYKFEEPQMHYLLLLGSVYRTALRSSNYEDVNLERLLLDVLQNEVPDMLEYPDLIVDPLLRDVQEMVNRSEPILSLMEQACDNLGDGECNKVISKLVENQFELLLPAKLLEVAGKLAEEYLAIQPRLLEVAENFDVLPYLLANRQYVLNDVRLLSEVLSLLGHHIPEM
ncbi:uncharacterized protein LOC128670115 [Plodia interpunctella]|uniref:uncharacterized protein LOC128670115 n=1 Tax=Plodia interpunctella TaxID=58824 RepID=UPI002367AA61|nr:uncharacterized protein LOC128670115 [Plodia interpunctella]